MRAALLSAMLFACSQPPSVTAVEPNRALPGEPVAVIGERFVEPVAVSLEGGAAPVPIQPSSVAAGRVTLTIPDGTAAGTYDLVVRTSGVAVRAPGAFLVLAPPADERGRWILTMTSSPLTSRAAGCTGRTPRSRRSRARS